MKKKVWEYVEKFHMIEPGDDVLVACSGGADSLALLLFLWEQSRCLDFRIKAVHVEHGIRGGESLSDAEFVRHFCEKRQIPCAVISVDAVSYARDKHLGLEEAARILRYSVLEEEALRLRGDGIQPKYSSDTEVKPTVKIALAHHQEDNAETILFQLVRGSGLLGMCGIAPVRQEGNLCYIRPFLCCSRGEIEQYLSDAGESFCVDSTNGDQGYSRNRIRSQIIPQLQEINHRAVEHMNRTASQLTEVWDYLNCETRRVLEEQVTRTQKGAFISASYLQSIHPCLQHAVVMELLAEVAGRRKDLTATHVQSALDLMSGQSGRRVFLPYQVTVTLEYDRLIFSRGEREENGICMEIPGKFLGSLRENGDNREVLLGTKGERLILQVLPYSGMREEIEKKTYTKTFDYDMIKFGFCVRNRREGDYLVLDCHGHRKKLSNYFIDEKIPASQRDSCVLLTRGSEIFWHVGGRIGENYKVTDDTRWILKITYCGGEKNGLFEET